MPLARPECLIVFTRFPEAGKTKTRLIPALGAKGAARLQRQMTEHIMATAAKLFNRPGLTIEAYHEGGNSDLMQAWLGSQFTYRQQETGNIGRRMLKAFENAFQDEIETAVIIGSDGVLPLTFKNGDSWENLGLEGSETFTITGIANIEPRKTLHVRAVKPDGREIEFDVTARLNTDIDVEYFEHGGILPYVLRKIMTE